MTDDFVAFELPAAYQPNGKGHCIMLEDCTIYSKEEDANILDLYKAVDIHNWNNNHNNNNKRKSGVSFK